MSAPLAPERLADVGAFCRLFRGMDVHDAALIEQCSTDDTCVDFGDRAYVASGRAEIGALFRRILTPGFGSSHLAVQPEIECTNMAEATGSWRFEWTSLTFDEPPDSYHEQRNASSYTDACVYTDDDVKNGVWRVARSADSLSFSVRQPACPEQTPTGTVLSAGGKG